MSKEQIYEIQTKVYASIKEFGSGIVRKMTPGVADKNFVINVKEAEEAMMNYKEEPKKGIKFDGIWNEANDGKFKELMTDKVSDAMSQYRIYYPLSVAELTRSSTITLTERKKTIPLPRIETEKPYIIRVTTRPGNYLVVMDSNKSHKDLKPREMQRMFTLAVRKGSIYEEQDKGFWTKFNLPRGQETFLAKQQTIVFHSEELISTNLQKQTKRAR